MWCDHVEHIVFVFHMTVKITGIISLNYLLAPWLYIPLTDLASLIVDTLSTTFCHHLSVVYWGRGVGGVQIPPEIPKALQNCAKLNPIMKTVKNCWI